MYAHDFDWRTGNHACHRVRSFSMRGVIEAGGVVESVFEVKALCGQYVDCVEVDCVVLPDSIPCADCVVRAAEAAKLSSGGA